MTPVTTSLEPQLSWEDVLGAATRREGERSFMLRLLQYFCQQYRLAGAALYSRSEQGFDRQVVAGTAAFSTVIRAGEQPFGIALELPEGLLVLAPGEASLPQLEGPLVLALSAALRAYLLRQSLKQKSFAVNYRGVELEALYDVGLAIASMLNLDQLGEEILLRAVSLLDARRGALYLRSGSQYLLDHTLGGEADPSVPSSHPALAEVLEGGLEGPHNFLPGARHIMAVPIGSEPEPEGLLIVADKESRRGVGPFADSDRRTLSLFANQAAIALETARLHRDALEKERLERDLDLAADIQQRLLPKVFPEISGYELIGWSRPARHVGGDFYDLIPMRGSSRIATVLADVTGKGMPAALMVSTVHSALRLLIDQVEFGPQLVGRLNRHIADSSAPNRFITLLLAELDAEQHLVRFVNAGHNPGLLLRSGGELELLIPGGMPLGLFENSEFAADAVGLGKGDLLCLYSDGITECTSPNDEEFGVERLVEILKAAGDRPLTEVVATVDRAVVEFAGDQRQADDQTLVLLRRSAHP